MWPVALWCLGSWAGGIYAVTRIADGGSQWWMIAVALCLPGVLITGCLD